MKGTPPGSLRQLDRAGIDDPSVAVQSGQLFTADDVGRLLAVKPSWVYAEARAGRLPHIRLGRYIRFNPMSVAAWVQQRERGPLGGRSVS